MLSSQSLHQSLPSKPGVYLFLNHKNRVIYVGKAKNLKIRVRSYFQNSKNLLEKTRILVSQITKIRTVIAESEIQALLLEANYIKLYKPKYNAKLTDGKAYPLIRITIKYKYPAVLIARRIEDNPPAGGSMYFGPFPNASAMRSVLKTVRRVFPFQSVINHLKKPCLYYHLNLCPCPEVFNDTEYKKNISRIVMFLKGNTKKVITDLEKERNALSKKEEFEKAGILQGKIDSINYVTSPAYNKFDFKVIPNLDEDLRYIELLELKTVLLTHNVSVKNLERIECYDISNTSGTNATGSMVVFVNGEKDLSQYRRFKIRYVQKVPDDFAMIREVISRRLNHKEWLFPDLIIVDGGKGQVSAALKALYFSSEVPTRRDESRSFSSRQARTISTIPIIGIAKKEETIIIPLNRYSGLSRIAFNRISRRDSGVSFDSAQDPQNDERGSFIEVSLLNDSPALHLIMRIRDEAHRFAVMYHRKLRSKQLISSLHRRYREKIRKKPEGRIE